MKRAERKLLRNHVNLCDQLVVSLDVFAEYFKSKPIGFSTLHVLVTAQNLITLLMEYSHINKQRLKYAPRRKKKRLKYAPRRKKK